MIVIAAVEAAVGLALIIALYSKGLLPEGVTPYAVLLVVVDAERPCRLYAALDEAQRASLREAALQHFEELIELVPNMNSSGEGSRARYFQLRGIGELEQYEGAPNPSVGFIIDDIDGVSGHRSSILLSMGSSILNSAPPQRLLPSEMEPL